MNKYIKVNDLSRVKFHPLPYTHITPADIKDAEAYELGWNDAIDAIIENAPTIDAVEVVRCKNCKWWDNEDNRPLGYCHAAKHCYYSRHWEIQIYRTTEPDFFCKDGERGED